MPHILACTDGSVYAPSVYAHAAWAAGRLDASVEVLHAIDHKRESAAIADLSGSIGVDARDDLQRQLADLEAAQGKVALARARAILADAAARLAEAGVAAPTLTQRHGSLVELLGEADSRHRPDLVVIGKRGEAADFASLHLGANLERVVRASSCPVLVASRAFAPIERVLIAFDGGASARRALAHAADGALLRGLELHVLTVGPSSPRHQEALALAREQLAHGGLAVRTALRDGDPEAEIARYVAEEGIGLLVVGAYGHSRIRQLLVGSTTTALIRTCLVPLLMVR